MEHHYLQDLAHKGGDEGYAELVDQALRKENLDRGGQQVIDKATHKISIEKLLKRNQLNEKEAMKLMNLSSNEDKVLQESTKANKTVKVIPPNHKGTETKKNSVASKSEASVSVDEGEDDEGEESFVRFMQHVKNLWDKKASAKESLPSHHEMIAAAIQELDEVEKNPSGDATTSASLNAKRSFEFANPELDQQLRAQLESWVEEGVIQKKQ